MNEQLFDLAENTSRSIFLTGKAGTGKTTFLNEFVRKTTKKHIVVAPTGIAAINAGGVTIHSMFGLPLRTFAPTTERIDGNLGMNIQDLLQHFKYRKDKLKLLQEIEMVIIDEVSMLRADVLDMMDFSLRHIRRNTLPFGGVQMLFIGDLYQLPPVVRDEQFIRQYYRSAFFFDSYVLKNVPLITIELTKVYRQKDEHFLEILNAIRDGNIEDIDFDILNKRYDPEFEPKDEAYVYLTSHNRMADNINQQKLKKLPGKSYFYPASITGEFRETQYPNEEQIELREGAQIMFIRNDASADHKYYNGKLAEVKYLDDEKIRVRIEGDHEDYTLKKEIWDQKVYRLDNERNIHEDVLGSFEQYPIRLAWAVTIHKSQGLTFDRLIIDAGKSFASGQVYVALSRCRTLEGIVLKSKITPDVILSDSRVDEFHGETRANDKINEILQSEKYDYSIGKILRNTDCRWIGPSVENWYSQALASRFLDKDKARQLYTILKKQSSDMASIYDKFAKILIQKTRKFIQKEETWEEIENKASGAVNFFFRNIRKKIFEELKQFYAETKGIKGLKQYNEEIRTLIDDTEDYLNGLKRITLLDQPLFDLKNDATVSHKIAKTPSHLLTFQLFEEGMTVSQIAKERGLVNETIFGHLAKFAEQGVLDIERIITQEKIEIFRKEFDSAAYSTLTEWKNALPNEFEFNEIRLLINHFTYLREKKNGSLPEP